MEATPSTSLDADARLELLRTAAVAIESGLAGDAAAPPDPVALPPHLRQAGASFVTLTIAGTLRGCCGSLEPARPLAIDVWINARATAFHDPRFLPLARHEWLRCDLEISVLSPSERIVVRSEAELVRVLVPGRDGLVLAWRGTRATFLPKVWEQLQDPLQFVRHLKEKAGWSADFWSEEIEVRRYGAEVMSRERAAGLGASPAR